jgi:hypothetical protein
MFLRVGNEILEVNTRVGTGAYWLWSEQHGLSSTNNVNMTVPLERAWSQALIALRTVKYLSLNLPLLQTALTSFWWKKAMLCTVKIPSKVPSSSQTSYLDDVLSQVVSFRCFDRDPLEEIHFPPWPSVCVWCVGMSVWKVKCSLLTL